MEKVAVGPLPPAPAQVVQFAHPVICSMFALVTAVEGGTGSGTGVGLGVGVGLGEGLGLGVGVGLGAVVVVIKTAVLKTLPAESHACTTTLCLAADITTEVSIFPALIR